MGTVMGSSGQKALKKRQIEEQPARKPPGRPKSGPTAVQKAAVELYGRGFRRVEVARQLLDHLCPDPDGSWGYEKRYLQARRKLRRWEREDWFRDRLYQIAVIDTDLATKDIMVGVTKRAMEGNVDAAKFAMEVTGRYTPKADPQPPMVSVVFSNLPRPLRREEQPAIEGEAVEVDSEP